MERGPPGRGRRPAPPASRRPRERSDEPTDFYAECIGGLEPFVASELASLGGVSESPHPALSRGERVREPSPHGRGRRTWGRPRPTASGKGRLAAGELPFRFAGPWRRLLASRTVTANHAVVAAGVPRPAALLDDGTLKRLLAQIGHIRSLHAGGAFRTFHLSAAGADSPVLRRFRERVAGVTGLHDVDAGGDLLARVRRAPRGDGFELTVRISPRPLATRAWRRCNLPGALNATVASVMATLAEPTSADVVLNLACGSGTLLVERAQAGPYRRLLGCDVDSAALACAAENVTAAGLTDVELQPWDATSLPLADGSVDALAVDLPFGQLVGSHGANERLYPGLLAEAARVARPGARLVAITQDVRLFERSAHRLVGTWTIERTLRLTIPTNGGPISPRVYVLRRGGGA